MTRFPSAAMFLLAALCTLGCTNDYEVAPDYRVGEEKTPAATDAPEAEAKAPQPASGQATPSQSAAPRSAFVKLSAGVALPQSLPMGTVMAFSVDYRFAGGGQSGASYFWVIVPDKGQPVRQPIQLQAHGTLQGFCQQLRPENGPFKSHIEDAQGTRISSSVPMASASL